VLVSGCDGYLRAIQIEDGREIGKLDLGSYMGASAAVRENRAYVGTFENEVLCVDLETLEICWRYRHPRRQFPFLSSAAVTENLVLIGGRDKMLHAIHRDSGQTAWTFSTAARIDSSPVVIDDRVICPSGSGLIYLLDLHTGELKWEFDSGDSFVSSPSVAKGRIVVGTESGLVYCFAGS
jgi:outer membrane protein assembly factor BamB